MKDILNSKVTKGLLGLSLVTFLIWYASCLPKTLFNDPESLVILDKQGQLMGAHVAQDEQWRFPETKNLNQKFITSLLTFEDKRFYEHWGVDLKAMARAVKLNLSRGKIISGGSTISMQLVRISRKNPDRTYLEKLAEVFRAMRIETRYSKDQILRLYASYAPFGGNVIGIDAASWKYFGKSQGNISWAEAAMLAVLPNAPSLVHPGKNRKTLLNKRNRLLKKLHKNGEFDQVTYELALEEPLPEKPLPIKNHAPHLSGYFLKKSKEGVQNTTIDLSLQKRVMQTVQRHGVNLQAKAVYNASALVLDANNGHVISYVGNTSDTEQSHQNHVDMIRSRRSTGSILKPLLYQAMLSKGEILPESIIEDMPTEYEGYSPMNYDKKCDGVIPASEMVSRSLNIPAVNMLSQYGVSDFLFDLRKYGFSTLTKDAHHYGLSLILGGGEVSSWDLAKAYLKMTQTLNKMESPMTFLRDDHSHSPDNRLQLDPMSIWYMMESMTEVMRPGEDRSWKVFSQNKKIAWKTGTSFGGRDAWAVGCTPEYVVVVWAGNTDGEGRPQLTGNGCAGPILFDIFDMLPLSGDWFQEPNASHYEEVNVCSHSGYKANNHCMHTERKRVPIKGAEGKPCSYCHNVALDATGTWNVTNSNYPPFDRIEKTYFTLPPHIVEFYATNHPDYEEVPPSISEAGNIDLIYPKPNTTVYLPRIDKVSRSKMVVQAVSDVVNDEIHWTLNNDYIGKTYENHSLSISPPPGENVLTLVNQIGERVEVKFMVEG